MKNILIVCGPTAVGKTKRAVSICKERNGEIISCDSRQIYKHLDICSNKEGVLMPSGYREIDGVPQYLTDIIEPCENYSAANFAADADLKIDEIIKRGKLPVVCGGTGLYIKALLYGLDDMPPADKNLRLELSKKSKEKLYEALKALDFEAAQKNKNNPQRLLRALEVNILSGKNMSAFFTQKKTRYDFELCLLEMPRDELYKRIDKRCRDIVENGLIDETREVLEMFGRDAAGLSAIGYKLSIDFLDNKISKEFLIEEFSRQTRRYAKRQITWFKSQI